MAGEQLFSGAFKTPREFESYYKKMASLYIYSYDPQEVVPTIASQIPYNIEITNLGFSNFLTHYNYEPYLEKITCETLIIFGKNDWINDPSLGELMAKRIPKCNLVLLDKCGHFIWKDQKDKFFSSLQDFLLASVKEEKNISHNNLKKSIY